jgi:carbamoyltransferase
MLNPTIERYMSNSYHGINRRFISPANQRFFKSYVADRLGISSDKVVLMDHHLAHAYTGYFGFVPASKQHKSVTVLTADAEGDGKCATVNVAEGKTIAPQRVTRARHSLAVLYAAVTEYLGMTVNEHEYKVMGLAPYAQGPAVDRTYEVLKPLVWVSPDMKFDTSIGSGAFLLYLERHLRGHRFDVIAGAVQRLTEDLLCEWVTRVSERYASDTFALSGGIFMNVKANKCIAELPGVGAVYPCPSAGDESTPIGAAYYGYHLLCRHTGNTFDPQPVRDLYLGPDVSDAEIEAALSKYGDSGLYVSKVQDVESEVAGLLSRGAVVARLKGRMEFGARALGNRSILADPRNYAIVRLINQQIKSRDFWMPFAATILHECQHDYLRNPKNLIAPHMMLAFDTTLQGRAELPAAIHPYDYSVRPQILIEADNPDYYRLICEFRRLTGVGAVLNTSFNLHGEPIVCSPEDALYTLVRSGLEYLAMGRYLVSKRNPS